MYMIRFLDYAFILHLDLGLLYLPLLYVMLAVQRRALSYQKGRYP